MKKFNGTVIRATTPKTAYVSVVSEWMHPKYLKKKKVSKTFAVHDEVGVHVGDEVSIVECRPLSATKYFRVEAVTKKATELAEVKPKKTEKKSSKKKK